MKEVSFGVRGGGSFCEVRKRRFLSEKREGICESR